MPEFTLHPQLAADCELIGDLELSRVLLLKDANYPWLLLVPRRDDLCELHELSRPDAHRLADESRLLARAMVQLFQPDKLNVAALGNLVPQLHVHHVARYRGDPAWPAPVWGKAPPEPYSAPQLQERCAALRDALEL